MDGRAINKPNKLHATQTYHIQAVIILVVFLLLIASSAVGDPFLVVREFCQLAWKRVEGVPEARQVELLQLGQVADVLEAACESRRAVIRSSGHRAIRPRTIGELGNIFAASESPHD